jgi:hypothetical protein
VSEGGLSHVRHARRSGISSLDQDFFLCSFCKSRVGVRRYCDPTSSSPAFGVEGTSQEESPGERGNR